MSSNVFQLPVNDNEQTRPQASPIEATPALAPEAAPQFVNSQLGHLSLEVEAHGQQILKNYRDNEWGEHANMGRKKALLTAEYVIGLREHTSVDPSKASLN